MKRLTIAVDGLVHDQGTLAVNDMAAAVILIAAEDVRMLDDDCIRTHFNHEAAAVLDARGRHEEFISAMDQDDQVINLIAMAGHVTNEIDHVERVGPGRLRGGNREFALGNREYNNSDAPNFPDQEAARGRKIFAGANSNDAIPCTG